MLVLRPSRQLSSTGEPRHIRIIRKKTSEGFSPWYLLLGATSSASGMLNLLIVQWSLIRCCKVESPWGCAESLLGFFQVFLQWLLFSIIHVLYMIYFPPHLKYQRTLPIAPQAYGSTADQASVHTIDAGADGDTDKLKVTTTPEWRLAMTLGLVIVLHVSLLLLLSLALLYTLPTTIPPHPLLQYLATFLGVSATILAVLQYAPQIYRTYQSGLVGALSLGTMAIQVPGSVLFVVSLVLRPGTDWTSWLAYAITGLMQGMLLVICLLWKKRQRELGIDDFGNSINGPETNDERRALVEPSD
ncbi:hypothetical protein BD324DRAFT_649221 [Kockovaella imperatae]|uniref:PQ loop repeat-domain-containing protein n=1 Tax=Kockovaella imperatae TaxID=4999 RepID=A0A1Y1UMB7_9TREE|nr:hypothetical protein BD324DRAFT_649221 [Kockovaella imperatae]ORX39132.1 hypothetical protein BD324DRAFT_649221 [Kockovaella imperatae]